MTYPIFEGNGTVAPRRPTLADFGGREFESVLPYLPNDRRRVPLHGYLQAAMAVDRACHSIPLLSIDFQAAVYPGAGTLLFVNSVVDGLTTSTVVLARYTAGNYRITWPAGSLPVRNHRTEGKQLGPTMSKACRVSQTTNQCIVSCYTATGDWADSPDYRFNVTIWGE